MDRVAGVSADLSPLAAWAAQIHEIYLAMQNAGFTGDEALTLISGMLMQPDTD